jgi:hypothetical protein
MKFFGRLAVVREGPGFSERIAQKCQEIPAKKLCV